MTRISIILISLLCYVCASAENLRAYQSLIGHEIIFPQSNEVLFDHVFTMDALKKKSTDKKYKANIDLQDCVVKLVDATEISNLGYSDRIFLTIELNAKNYIVALTSYHCQPSFYDKTFADSAFNEYIGVLTRDFDKRVLIFNGLQYDLGSHCYVALNQLGDPLPIPAAVPTLPHSKFEHTAGSDCGGLCRLLKYLEEGQRNDSVIPQVKDKLIRY